MYYLIIFYVGRHCDQVHHTVLKLSVLYSKVQHTVLKLSVLYSQTVLKYSTVLNGIIYYIRIIKHNYKIQSLRTTLFKTNSQ